MKPTIAMFVHQPRCSVQSANGIMRALSPHYQFKIFTRQELEDDFFDDVDLVVFPGGIGDSDSWDYLFKFHQRRIQDFVAAGGRYLGICMGAYWADHHYFGLTDIKVEQYIRRPRTCTRRYYSKAVACNWNGYSDRFFFYDGPAFIGDERKFDVIARYSNGDPAAIIQGRCGLIGPHLESQISWYDRPYLQRHWHDNTHGKLLLEFVDRLMER
jgi:glutamine amidotransferase-like uncharacterized protein